MSEKNALTEVSFHGAKLIAQRGETPETTLVAMKPIVEGMGLDWGGQHKRLLAHPVLAKAISVMEIPSAGGTQQAIGLQLTRLNFWLATVSTQRVPDADTRRAIILYQEEAADALFRHFFGQAAAKVTGPTKGELARMIAAISDSKLADHLAPIHAAFAELVEKVDDIAANRIADPAATPTRDFMTALAYLEAKGWPSKGRRAVVNAVSARLMRHSERHGFPTRTTAERGTRLFHLDAWKTWENAGGRAFLSALWEERAGQSSLAFGRRHRKKAAA